MGWSFLWTAFLLVSEITTPEIYVTKNYFFSSFENSFYKGSVCLYEYLFCLSVKLHLETIFLSHLTAMRGKPM